jgi:hypothetical protein
LICEMQSRTSVPQSSASGPVFNRSPTHVRLNDLGVAGHLLGRPESDRAAFVQDLDPMAEPEDQSEVVISDDDRAVEFFAYRLNHLQQRFGLRLVHAGSWFVQEQGDWFPAGLSPSYRGGTLEC